MWMGSFYPKGAIGALVLKRVRTPSMVLLCTPFPYGKRNGKTHNQTLLQGKNSFCIYRPYEVTRSGKERGVYQLFFFSFLTFAFL
jgi:hypothetical protein